MARHPIPLGVAVALDERDEALGDYWAALQTLRLASAWLHKTGADDAPHLTEAQLLEQVDKARQALQIVAACAQFVGRK